MLRSKHKFSSGSRNKSSSLLTLNEIDELEKSFDWRKNYTVKPKEIGRGYFSKVFQIRCETRDKSFAAKVIRRRKGGIDRLDKIRKEANIIRRLNEKKIVSVIQILETYESFSDVVLICELAHGGSLFNLIQESETGLDQNYVRCVIYKLLLALESIHLNNIVHLDIKADNILLREPYPSTNIAICDFGLATELKEGINHKELVGTPDYMAPEVVNYEIITFNADMWSVGVLVYYLLSRISPFMGKSKDETLINVSKVKIVFDSIFNQPDLINVKSFISSLCIKSPELRLSSSAAQHHSWFDNIYDLNIDFPLRAPNFDNVSDNDTNFDININNFISVPLSSAQRCQSVDLHSLGMNSDFRLINTASFDTALNDLDYPDTVNDFLFTNHNPNRNLPRKLMHVDEVADELFYDYHSNDIAKKLTNSDVILRREKKDEEEKNTTTQFNTLSQEDLGKDETNISNDNSPGNIFSPVDSNVFSGINQIQTVDITDSIKREPDKISTVYIHTNQINLSQNSNISPSDSTEIDSGYSESSPNHLTVDLDEYDNISTTCEEKTRSKPQLNRYLSREKKNYSSIDDADEDDDYRYTSLLTQFRFSEFCILL